MQRRAVIDIGTNSVKLLVADVEGRTVQPVIETNEQTRLGRSFSEGNRLQADAIALTARVVADFAKRARASSAEHIRVIATSAARDAVNAGELTTAIEQAAGLKVEIISGEQEADWAFQGVTSDPALAGETLLLLDVGGGSTEFILGSGNHQHFRGSFQLGALRLLDRLKISNPPTAQELAHCRQDVEDFLRKEICPKLESALQRERNSAPSPVRLIGTGGTVTILSRIEGRIEKFDRQRIETIRLTRAQVQAHVERLWSLPVAEREKIVGLPKSRVDVILPGVVIYETVMAMFGFDELRPSTRGLRFAALMGD